VIGLAGVLGPDEDFQQVVQVALDALAQHKAMIAREFAGVIAGPQDEVIRFGDDHQFLAPFAVGHVCFMDTVR
jgi:hypothetical protein